MLHKTLLTKSLFQLHFSTHEDATLEHLEVTQQNSQGPNSIYNISKFQV